MQRSWRESDFNGAAAGKEPAVVLLSNKWLTMEVFVLRGARRYIDVAEVRGSHHQTVGGALTPGRGKCVTGRQTSPGHPVVCTQGP